MSYAQQLIDQQVSLLRGRLVDATIKDVCTTPPNDPDPRLGLHITPKLGAPFILWVQCDPEDNGPGYLSPQEL
jgi:hypothetical protein